MEKLLNSLRAHCLSIFTVSRWMDDPESKRRRAARAFVLSGPLLYLLRARAFTAPTAVFYLDSTPSHPRNVGGWERQSHGNWRVFESRRWRGQGRPRQALLAVCARGSLTSRWRPWGGWGPLHTLLPGDLATFTPLSRASPTFLRRQWSKIERQSQPAVLYKKGAIDSGISETNLTLVFRLFQTIKIKAGLRWLPSSESCYVFLIWQG